jgi:hypothetical protein
MKSLNILIFIFIWGFTYSSFCGETPKKNEYVDIQIKIKQNEFKPGSTGELEIRFKTKEGIHINFEPPISLKFDSTALLYKVEKLNVPRKPKQEYLNTAQPLIQKFTLAKNISTGTSIIKGTLTYFYCSGSDGWCSRFKYPFEVPIKIK